MVRRNRDLRLDSDPSGSPIGPPRRRDVTLAALFSALGLVSCTNRRPVATATTTPNAPLSFDQAVLEAANAVLAGAAAMTMRDASGRPAGSRQPIVIDPLIDGVTGEQSVATQTIGARIAALARQNYPQYDVQTFTRQTLSELPLVILGTFTPVNANNQTAGERDAFRFCLIIADLRSGRVVARKWVRAALGGVDTTPTPFFRDSPTWTDDPGVKRYIDFCQGVQVGDRISPAYLEGLVAASIINDAIEAYDGGRYAEAIDLYNSAKATPAGRQLRVYNGLYLANRKLGRQEPAATAFSEAVAYGLGYNLLGVKILFRPGTVALDSGPDLHPYEMWVHAIAERTAERRACLQVIGNTSNSGSAEFNERLSALRAEFIRSRLAAVTPQIENRLTAIGVGAKNNMVGTGADDASDALDRRVEFKVASVC